MGWHCLKEDELTASERVWAVGVWKVIMGWQCLKEFGLKMQERIRIEKCVKGQGLSAFGIAMVEWISQSDSVSKRIGWQSFGWILGPKRNEVWVRLYKILHNWHCFHINLSCITFV